MKQISLTIIHKQISCVGLCVLAIVGLIYVTNMPPKTDSKPTKLQIDLQHALNQPDSVPDSSSLPALTIDNALQSTVKSNLKGAMLLTASKSSTAIMVEANTGAIKVMTSLANPNPAICNKADLCSLPMQNGAITAWEPGSVMKPLLLAAAFDRGSLKPGSSYYESGVAKVQDRSYMNAEDFPSGMTTMQDILTKSLNTGAVHVLKSLGGGEVNIKARQVWYDYLTEHYQFGKTTGLPLFNESSGEVRRPVGGRNLPTQYAGSAFGVGITVTPIQLVAAYGALVNGGTYYRPYLAPGSQVIGGQKVISKQVSEIMTEMLHQTLVVNQPKALRTGYVLGAKSGTAPLPGQDGAYKPFTDSGTYIGYIGKIKPEYIMLIRLDEPHTDGFASAPARELWSSISNQLIAQGKIK